MNMFKQIKESISNKSIHDFMKFAEPKDVCIICKKSILQVHLTEDALIKYVMNVMMI